MDYLTSTLVWILGTFGMATIIVNSQIMLPVRNFLTFSKMLKDESGNYTEVVERKFKFFGKLVNCILCMGFWSGIFWGSMYWHPFEWLGPSAPQSPARRDYSRRDCHSMRLPEPSIDRPIYLVYVRRQPSPTNMFMPRRRWRRSRTS